MVAVLQDVFNETRSILEPAGAVAVAGAKAYLKHHNIQVGACIAREKGFLLLLKKSAGGPQEGAACQWARGSPQRIKTVPTRHPSRAISSSLHSAPHSVQQYSTIVGLEKAFQLSRLSKHSSQSAVLHVRGSCQLVATPILCAPAGQDSRGSDQWCQHEL